MNRQNLMKTTFIILLLTLSMIGVSYQTAQELIVRWGDGAGDEAQIVLDDFGSLNDGKYLEENLLDARPSDFCIGVGAYPEKHLEAPNLNYDIQYLKKKINAGAEYVVTQMLYSNDKYFSFVEKCRTAGIEVPIIPGLKIITSKRQMQSIPRNFNIDLPAEFTNEIMEAKSENILEVGVNWSLKQVTELFDKKAPAIHFYIMQDSKPINMLMHKLGM